MSTEKLKIVLFIVSSVLFLTVSGNIFRMILLISFGTVYISELKNKGITSGKTVARGTYQKQEKLNQEEL